MKPICFVGLMTFATAANAHVFDDLKIAGFSESVIPKIYDINLQGTVKGREIVCALFDETGELLTSTIDITDNLATHVMIHYDGSRRVHSARCVFND